MYVYIQKPFTVGLITKGRELFNNLYSFSPSHSLLFSFLPSLSYPSHLLPFFPFLLPSFTSLFLPSLIPFPYPSLCFTLLSACFPLLFSFPSNFSSYSTAFLSFPFSLLSSSPLHFPLYAPFFLSFLLLFYFFFLFTRSLSLYFPHLFISFSFVIFLSN